jgi:hypothetical protein
MHVSLVRRRRLAARAMFVVDRTWSDQIQDTVADGALSTGRTSD